MFTVQTLNSISPSGLNNFPSEWYAVDAKAASPEIILVRSADLHEFEFAPGLQVVGRAGAGVNNIPVERLTRLGVPVLNTPGANANAVCELVLAGMLVASRNLCQAWDYVHTLQVSGSDIHARVEADKKQFIGRELRGKTLGVVGLGAVGVKVANAAQHLGMQVIGFDPLISVNHAWELSSQVGQAQSLDALLEVADYVSLHVPLMPQTQGLMNASRLKKMKPEAVLLNFAREGVVDEAALIEALQAKTLALYVNDFPSNALKDHPQVIALPHLGASTLEAEENCAVMIVDAVRSFMETGSIHHSVNFPEVILPQLTSISRLTIVNANIPNMVAQISTELAGQAINIVSLVNQSRGEIAYTVVDVNTRLRPEVIEAVKRIRGVVQVRELLG